ncbi:MULTISPECIES: 3'-5' exonuclease [Nitrosomonas]|uniref:DNA polymerase III epsilon subunit-like protein n=1 Tax=Nitrosomonas communis TaxID=44574 RepID=A0A0F7KF83_9PROT|nr:MULTISPECIES: 3'-5' exonuclease [Nitrosomonas]AKH37828.1 exonuclease [Nitrosomonas communis]TYP92899.1 DNA polymerase III epsilon subunit-like protein [Nitrosomonas communis]UVS63178.1 3'-5' exonuclease [Nitrosomonas sp. PLL12]
MNTKREVFISVDVETSGPIPGKYSLLTIGACVVFDDTMTFTCKLKPTNRNADPEALAITGLSLDTLEREGIAAAEAIQMFYDWVLHVAGSDGTPIFVGFNAAFDWSFINYYFHYYIDKNPFGFAALDIKSLYMGFTKCSWDQTKSSQISSNLKPKLIATHDALQDARYQAELFRLIRSR